MGVIADMTPAQFDLFLKNTFETLNAKTKNNNTKKSDRDYFSELINSTLKQRR